MLVDEMVAILEGIARDEGAAASSRVRALEVLLRVDKDHSPDDREWERILESFGDD
jgi:hypothetical protein